MNRRLAVLCLLALVTPLAAQQRLPPPIKDLPRAGSIAPPPVFRAPGVATPPEDSGCDRREWVRLATELLKEPPRQTTQECRPSTAWAVCQAKADSEGNAERRFGILSDIEALSKICKSEGFGQPVA